MIPALLVSASLSAAEPEQFGFELRIRDGDAAPVRLTLRIPDNTTHQLQVNDRLRLTVRGWTPAGEPPRTRVTLVDARGIQPMELGAMERWAPPAQLREITFVACEGRVIGLETVGGEAPGCAGLPAMTRPEPITDKGCGDCAGPYEGMPADIASRARIAPTGEEGEPLHVTGRVLGPDGRPRPGVIVYAYQTDRFGIYPPPVPPRSLLSNHHGTLRGWARSDARGRYAFDTIRPASYPQTTNPQHIHMHVIEPGCMTYFIDEMLFTDDPMYARLSAEERARMQRGFGGSGVVTPRKRARTMEATRDIHLGRNIPDYAGCPAPN
jgi:protocatechuate 3,4-dioxygenase beta subunit